MEDRDSEFVFDKREILQGLTNSKQHGLSVGILSDYLGAGTIVTAVDDIIFKEEALIVLKRFDANGRILKAHRLFLSEIIGILPFQSPFENPFYRSTKFSKTQND